MHEYLATEAYHGSYVYNDVGYATITNSETKPTYNHYPQNHFMCIAGTEASKDYVSSTLQGGNTYYLHLGYTKDGYSDSGEDRVVINSIKLYEYKPTTFYFEGAEQFKSNNQGQANTVANSYIPIDLSETPEEESVSLTVNAEISSEKNDYGYVTITKTPERVEYDKNDDTATQLVCISGEQQAKDYTMTLQGGEQYYLHLGYYKNGNTDEGMDVFTINRITVNDIDYRMYTTDEKGKISLKLPVGTYEIIEKKAPEGYQIKEAEMPKEVTITRETQGVTQVDVINEQYVAEVIVNHYIYNRKLDDPYTTEKVTLSTGSQAEEKIITGHIGDIYGTRALQDLAQGYELYEEPTNSSGLMKKEPTYVNYYYATGAKIADTITKDGTQIITSKDEEVHYKINYTAKVSNYNGNATVTITDTLPYKLNKEAMKNIEGVDFSEDDWLEKLLGRGSYDEGTQTITWTETYEGINTEGEENGEKEITIEKDITVIFDGINTAQANAEFTNKVQGIIDLEATEQIKETEEVTHTTTAKFVKDVKVTKKWEHGENIYERPTAVKVKIINPKTPDEAIDEEILSKENNWTYTFKELPKYDAETGEEIEYTVEEQAIEGESLDYYKRAM